MLATVLGGAIWIRRFGSRARTWGSFLTLPFITLLVAPVLPTAGHEHSAWPAVVAVVSLVWVRAAHAVAVRLGVVPRSVAEPSTGPTRRPRHGLRVSTRMAIQVALAVLVAFALAQWWFPGYWVWAARVSGGRSPPCSS